MDRITSLFGSSGPASRELIKVAFGAAFVGLATFAAYRYLRYRGITVSMTRSETKCAETSEVAQALY